MRSSRATLPALSLFSHMAWPDVLVLRLEADGLMISLRREDYSYMIVLLHVSIIDICDARPYNLNHL